MAISKVEFRQAFREAVSMEFAYIPMNEDDIDFTFSHKFTAKMEKLIRSQKKSYWQYINTASKRAAVIFVGIATALAMAFSVKAIREPVVSFFTEVYNTYIRYIFEGDTVREITHEYTLGYVPAGFEQVSYVKDSSKITTVFENEKGDTIKFYQCITKNLENTVDCEHGKTYSVCISEIEVSIIEIENIKEAFWIQDGYALSIVTCGNVSSQALTDMIASVE